MLHNSLNARSSFTSQRKYSESKDKKTTILKKKKINHAQLLSFKIVPQQKQGAFPFHELEVLSTIMCYYENGRGGKTQ